MLLLLTHLLSVLVSTSYVDSAQRKFYDGSKLLQKYDINRPPAKTHEAMGILFKRHGVQIAAP